MARDIIFSGSISIFMPAGEESQQSRTLLGTLGPLRSSYEFVRSLILHRSYFKAYAFLPLDQFR